MRILIDSERTLQETSPFSERGLKKVWPLEESFSRPDRAEGSDIFQSKSEAKTAFYVGADIELTDFEAQAVAVRIIANLRDGTLEK